MSKVFIQSNELMPLVIERLNNQQKIEITVRGQSMLPFFKDGKTAVRLKPIIEPKQRDVVLFSYQNGYILHRIIKIKDETIICQGDALKSKEIIQKQDILAVVENYTYKHKTIHTNQKKYRFKVWLWIILKPFRRILLKLVRK